ncbi:MAG: hypothetical protein VR69_10345 [Peptococcaceae bacterium BRH_c4b]|nr:MAG: hypothetical protein VR69_10345 [Peptococcaceae bacterium BRH_c4b]
MFKSGLKKLKRWVVGQELAESMPGELGPLGLTMNQEAPKLCLSYGSPFLSVAKGGVVHANTIVD